MIFLNSEAPKLASYCIEEIEWMNLAYFWHFDFDLFRISLVKAILVYQLILFF